MKRALIVCAALGMVVVVIAGGMATAYFLARGAEHLCPGAGSLTNILILMLVFVMVIATLLTIAERKWSAMIQDRIGPNRARIDLPLLRDRTLGWIAPVAADVLKMLFKEDFIPARANRFLFNLGPILAFRPVLALFAVVPAGPTISLMNREVRMVIAEPDF